MADPTHADYANAEGSPFTIQGHAGEGTALTLHAVSPLRSSGGYDNYTLTFHSSLPSLGQATFDLRHDELGNVSIFMTPTGVHGESAVYEAVFNTIST